MPICFNCGNKYPRHARFCPSCGVALAAPAGGEERKIVSVLVCDLVGFTARSDQADPEDVQATLTPYHDRARTEIERLGGTVEKFIGDAVVGVFGVPAIHEDDAARAVQAALGICRAISELNQRDPPLDLAVRVAVNTGEALVSLGARPEAGEHFVAGDVVNTAARLQGVAPIGAVVVGDATYRATKGLVEYETLPPVRVKGKAQPLSIWRALAVRYPDAEAEQHWVTPFVGRHAELELLNDLYASWLRERAIRLVPIIGAPAVGKSRLVREFRRIADRQAGVVAWRYGRCLPYREGVTFGALGEAVKADLGILEVDTTAAATAKLEAAIRRLEDDPAEQRWLMARLGPLVGLANVDGAGAVERREAFTAWRRFLEARAATGPLVVVLEDLHWADEALLAFVEHLLTSAAEAPLLLITTARPEFADRAPNWPTEPRGTTTSITLPPLSDQDTARLVARLLAIPTLPPELGRLLLERAGGNPFYAEQFIRLLLDQGLVEPTSGAVTVGPDAVIPVPETVTALIAARLDTLQPAHKTLLQDASVIGQVFSTGVLAAVGHLDAQVARRALRQLAHKDFVRAARRSSAGGQATYSFSHALLREVAYRQLPRAARLRRHQAAAVWIEQAAEPVANQAEILAHHYGQALALARATRATDERPGLEAATRRFSMLAGDRALGLDVARAEAYYRDALRLTRPGHPDRAQVAAKLARAALQAGRLTEARRTYQDVIAQFQTYGDRLAAGDAMARLGRVLWTQGDTKNASRARLQAVRLLETEPAGPALANAYAEMAFDQLVVGRAQQGLQWAQKALAVATGLDLGEERSRALDHQGLARVMLGDPGGLDDLRAALKLAQDLGSGDQAVISYTNLAGASWPMVGPAVALQHYRAGIDFAERRGIMESATWARSELLGPLFDLGRWDTLLDVADEVIAATGASEDRYLPTWARVEQAHVLLYRGELQRAAQLAEALLPVAREIGDLQVLVPALVVTAGIKQHTGNLATARELVAEVDRATSGSGGWDRAQALPDLLRVCAATGQHLLGRRLLSTTNATAVRHRHGLVTGQAILAEGQGDLQAAVRHYRQAVKGWTVYGHVLEQGQALLGMGRCMVQLPLPGAAGSSRTLDRCSLGYLPDRCWPRPTPGFGGPPPTADRHRPDRASRHGDLIWVRLR